MRWSEESPERVLWGMVAATFFQDIAKLKLTPENKERITREAELIISDAREVWMQHVCDLTNIDHNGLVDKLKMFWDMKKKGKLVKFDPHLFYGPRKKTTRKSSL